jgi:hypothetical protein
MGSTGKYSDEKRQFQGMLTEMPTITCDRANSEVKVTG